VVLADAAFPEALRLICRHRTNPHARRARRWRAATTQPTRIAPPALVEDALGSQPTGARSWPTTGAASADGAPGTRCAPGDGEAGHDDRLVVLAEPRGCRCASDRASAVHRPHDLGRGANRGDYRLRGGLRRVAVSVRRPRRLGVAVAAPGRRARWQCARRRRVDLRHVHDQSDLTGAARGRRARRSACGGHPARARCPGKIAARHGAL
jgi:hypothetical protein